MLSTSSQYLDISAVLKKSNLKLSQKQIMQHGLFSIIDLEAVKNNYKLLKTKHINGCCGAVIKANAYGLGIVQVAPALFDAGCREFFVSNIDEGINARKFLPNSNIYIINGLMPGAEKIFEYYNLIPTLNDLGQVERWSKYCQIRNRKLAAVIQFDTGMHRGGLNKHETILLLSHLEYCSTFTLKFIMSHLSCADVVSHPMNYQQNIIFQKIRNSFQDVPATFANSSAIFLGDDYHYDLLRPGASIYGISPTPYQNNPMQQVLRTYAQIIQLHELQKNDVVGYAAAYKVKRDTKIAILSVGYSNGYPWNSANKGWGYIKEYKVPILGRISMNAIIIDITDVPPPIQIYLGALVELIGPNINLDTIAKQANTIPREILNRIAAGTKKFFVS